MRTATNYDFGPFQRHSSERAAAARKLEKRPIGCNIQERRSKIPGNYRPIAILSILYKMFTRMLCIRVQRGLLREQSVDQGAYRPGFSTKDHLLCTTLLLEHCAEWNMDLWIYLIDFEKDSDTVEHEAPWKVLEDQGVHFAYVDLLKPLYKEQTASAMAGCHS